MKDKKEMSVSDIHQRLVAMWGKSYWSLYIPEFTWEHLRIDGIMIDTKHRWIRGFEIKTRKQDFNSDNKWTEYSRFCSSLSIVCPANLIQPHEIESPFGLLWIEDCECKWKKRPKNFQKRKSLSWVYTYTRVLELEMRRLSFECEQHRISKQRGSSEENKRRAEIR